MSDAHNEHASVIKTPKQLIAAVVGFFLVVVLGIILLVQFVTTQKLTGAGTESQSADAVATRIQPVAEQGFSFKDANAPKVLQSGEAVYTATCAACHGTGAAGAPKFGDSSAWAARISQGFETLVKHATEGIRAMPAKGGNPDLDNIEVARAVAYMANKAGAKFTEPAAPAAAAAPAKVAADAGKTLYTATCQACHGAGIAGAPKFGDKAAWAGRIAQGQATLYEHAIKGFQGKAGVMPPKGGSSAHDADVKAAVDYMVASSK
jgi:cytochrome c5